MNERIKELSKEAGLVADATYAKAPDAIWLREYNKKFAELIVQDYAKQLVQANMNNHWYVQAMDEHYEQKWAHRFD